MIWSFINNCFDNISVKWNYNSVVINKDDILYNILKSGEIIKKYVQTKVKCVILCESEINVAISILICWYANIIPIPLSKNYGKKHYDSIVNHIKPDLMLSDNINLNTYNIPIYDINLNIFKNIRNYKKADHEEDLSDVAIIMCTSGTTGSPKCAMITEESLTKNVNNIAKYFKVNNNETILITRPLYHCAVLTGEFLISLYKGLNIYFYDDVFNPIFISNIIENNNIGIMCGTPTLFNHLSYVYKRNNTISCLKTIVISGEILSKKVALNIRTSFPDADIYNVYGLTEAAPRVSWLSPDLYDKYPESVGVPLDETIIKIVSDCNYNEVLLSEEKGVVFVKSPSIMKGYYNNIELTNKKILDGWLNTGDIGYKDDNGLLYICSREDDMIIKAGMNIYPQEIENSIKQLNIVEDVIAYGIKNNTGEMIAIDIVLKEVIIKKDLLKKISSILPSYQMPEILNIVDKINRNASGKKIRPRL